MAYLSIGRVLDVAPLQELARLLIPPQHPGVGYVTVHDPAVAEAFKPHVGFLVPGAWSHCFLSVVWHNGSIAPHEDSDPGWRRHLVLQTNPDAWWLHDGTWQQLQEGGLYTMDPTKPHASVNWGHPPRTLLIIDTPR